MTYSSVVAVLALVGLTEKCFGHHAILKILSFGSPSVKRWIEALQVQPRYRNM